MGYGCTSALRKRNTKKSDVVLLTPTRWSGIYLIGFRGLGVLGRNVLADALLATNPRSSRKKHRLNESRQISFQLKIEHVFCASVRAVCTGLSGEISALTFCELSGQRASNRSRGAFEPLRLRPGHIPLLKAPCPKPEQTARVGREVVSLMEPKYVFEGNDSTGAAKTHWECAMCGMVFRRRKPCTAHMGLTINVPASCSVLTNEDEKRRASLRQHMELVQEQGYDDTWVWSPEKVKALAKAVRP